MEHKVLYRCQIDDMFPVKDSKHSVFAFHWTVFYADVEVFWQRRDILVFVGYEREEHILCEKSKTAATIKYNARGTYDRKEVSHDDIW